MSDEIKYEWPEYELRLSAESKAELNNIAWQIGRSFASAIVYRLQQAIPMLIDEIKKAK